MAYETVHNKNDQRTIQRTIQIGNHIIGDGCPTYIIAEVSINHGGNLESAKKLIDVAVEAKADAVKFQKRHLPSLYSGDMLENTYKYEQHFQYLLPILKETELTELEHSKLKEYAINSGIEYLCTPFDLQSARFLKELGVNAVKTASCDLTNMELMGFLGKFSNVQKKPLIISTGMSSWEEIRSIVQVHQNHNVDFALLHCRSAYPVWPREANLKMITKLKEFGVPVGYSGHDIGIIIPLVAASMGACIIEKHVTLDRAMSGPDHKISLEPDELKVLVRDVRIADQAMASTERFLLRGEILNKDMFRYRGRHTSGLNAPKIQNDIPGKWGLIARHSDIDEVARFKPKVIEYRMTENDFDQFKPKDYSSIELVVHAPEYIGDKLLDLCSGNEEIRWQSVRMVNNTIDAAWQMSKFFKGNPKVIVHPGAMSMSTALESHTLKGHLLDSLGRIQSPILLENLPPYPHYFGGCWKGNYFMDPNEIKEFCDETGMKICFDLSHAALYCNSRESSLEQYIKIVKPHCRHFHISDAYGLEGEGVQIGKGDICMPKIILLLFQEYTGTWVSEVWLGHKNNHREAIEALNRIKKHFDGLV